MVVRHPQLLSLSAEDNAAFTFQVLRALKPLTATHDHSLKSAALTFYHLLSPSITFQVLRAELGHPEDAEIAALVERHPQVRVWRLPYRGFGARWTRACVCCRLLHRGFGARWTRAFTDAGSRVHAHVVSVGVTA